jgi:phosphatidate cytidylyltransferase
VVWISWFSGHLILVLQLTEGYLWLVFLLLVITLTDTFAYLVGTLFGRHVLLPGVSPSKTLEGSLGGLAGSVVGGGVALTLVLGRVGQELPLGHLVGLCIALGLLGQAGDLIESLVKRAAGAKDSGVFMPGHGGVLDRMDAFLLAPALLYYYLELTGR